MAALPTLSSLLTDIAAQDPDRPAILAPNRAPLGRLGLQQQISNTVEHLRAFGIAPTDRVALVLDNGPEMATAFLAIASFASCVPLNPSSTPSEFKAAFELFSPKAVISSTKHKALFSDMLSRQGTAVFEVVPNPSRNAGIFDLDCCMESKLCQANGAVSCGANRSSEQPALLLQTSGTTARPKVVGLKEANLLSSAQNIACSLALNSADRCLNIMPMFHIHGLLAGLLAPLWSGGCMVASPAFDVRQFFDLLEEFRPTWYTGVPTMHATIATRAGRNSDGLRSHSLRLIRSCSAALPPRLMHEVEDRFGVPVLEAYGMTEACHQIACNPLPPAQRKPGSVGIPTGTEVGILGEGGHLIGSGAEGEIVVFGPSVIDAYIDNPLATASSFVNGWFRTGDIGWIDDDGYIFIKARAKEIINRGGAKISPFEVEQILLEHPAVAEAAVFSVPEDRLGECVGAAVVLHSSFRITDTELREFTASKLSRFKAPQHIIFVDEIPKGPTGKVQRIGLAERLGVNSSKTDIRSPSNIAGSGHLEELLSAMWARVLGIEAVRPNDNFFELGGDSAAATELVLDIEQATGSKLPIGALFEAPTVAELAHLIQSAFNSKSRAVPIRATGSHEPFFCVGAGPLFWSLAQQLGAEQPFYSLLLSPDDLGAFPNLEEIAACHVRSIRAVQPSGPYFIGGWCRDGVVAYEIGQQLLAEGEKVELLVLFDAVNPGCMAESAQLARPFLRVIELLRASLFHLRAICALPRDARLNYGYERLSALLLAFRRRLSLVRSYADKRFNERLRDADVDEFTYLAVLKYHPKPYVGRVVLYKRTTGVFGVGQKQALGWSALIQGGFAEYQVPGDHRDMFLEPQVSTLATTLRPHLRRPEALRGHEVQGSKHESPVATIVKSVSESL